MVSMDRTNLKLLDLLSRDARSNYVDLADAVDRAESTVRERVARLEQAGVIRGYRAVTAPEKIGFEAAGLLRAEVDRSRATELVRQLAEIPYVTEAVLTTGARPLHVELAAKNLVQLERVVERHVAPLGLGDLEVNVVLRTLVCDRPLPVRALLDPEPSLGTESDETVWRPLGRERDRPLPARPRAGAKKSR